MDGMGMGDAMDAGNFDQMEGSFFDGGALDGLGSDDFGVKLAGGVDDLIDFGSDVAKSSKSSGSRTGSGPTPLSASGLSMKEMTQKDSQSASQIAKQIAQSVTKDTAIVSAKLKHLLESTAVESAEFTDLVSLSHSKSTAARAFLQILVLASNSTIGVEQSQSTVGNEIAPIVLSMREVEDGSQSSDSDAP